MMFDNHTHSVHSADGRIIIPEGIRRAQEMCMGGITFTDHYDFEVPAECMEFIFDPAKQQADIEHFRESIVAPYDFKVLKGVEIGVQPDCIESMRELMSRYSFDCVIASLHFIDGKDPFHGNYYIPYDYKQAYSHYLETFLQCITLFDDFDILGHFDYIARYSPYPESESTIHYSEFRDVIDEIFKLLISRGQTFEINTKTYQYYRGKEPQLDINILKRFKELGGEAVSLGSDAHDIKRIGENFNRFIPMLEVSGIKYTVHFEGRQSIFTRHTLR